MKRNLLVIFFALTLTGNLFAQNPLMKQWDYRFGGTELDQLNYLQQTKDGGFILGGESFSGISGDKTQPCWDTSSNLIYRGDYWIVKIDSLGNKQWDKDFGGTDQDYLLSVQQTADGGYILGGTSNSRISGDKTEDTKDTLPNSYFSGDYWIVKVDSQGIKQWDKDFGGVSIEYFHGIQQTEDGGYILGGYSWSGIGGDKTQMSWGNSDYWIIKTDSLGNKQWDKDFGGTFGDDLFSIQQTSDRGFILGGLSASGINGDKTQPTWGGTDYWIVKTDSLGNKQWDKDFGGTGSDHLFSIQQTFDGGYILGGQSNSGISGDKTQPIWDTCITCATGDYWIVKTDSLGNKQWDKDFGGTDNDLLYSINQTIDGGYLITGSSYSTISGNKTENNLGPKQTWVVKTDSLGNLLWDKTIFTAGHDETCSAIQTKDGCYVMENSTYAGIGGYKTQSSWNFSRDYWIIKFCDTTSTTSINQISNSQLPFSIYPNPTNAKLNLVLSNKENIVITNLVGEIVLEKSAEGKIELDVSFLSAGIYFIKAGNEVRKFVKE